MKVGDTFFVIKPYKALYGKIGGSYDYHFIPGHKYHSVNYCSLTNITTGDGVSHFGHDELMRCFVTADEYREMKLKELGI